MEEEESAVKDLFFYCELGERNYAVMENSTFEKNKAIHVATVRSDIQARRLTKLLNAIPQEIVLGKI